MDPRETEELLNGLFGSESLWCDSDEDIETSLDGAYWDQRNLQVR